MGDPFLLLISSKKRSVGVVVRGEWRGYERVDWWELMFDVVVLSGLDDVLIDYLW